MNFQEIKSYEESRNKQLHIFDVIKIHLEHIFQSLARKITFRQKYQDPWTASSCEFVQKDILYWYRAIRDHEIAFGRRRE